MYGWISSPWSEVIRPYEFLVQKAHLGGVQSRKWLIMATTRVHTVNRRSHCIAPLPLDPNNEFKRHSSRVRCPDSHSGFPVPRSKQKAKRCHGFLLPAIPIHLGRFGPIGPQVGRRCPKRDNAPNISQRQKSKVTHAR